LAEQTSCAPEKAKHRPFEFNRDNQLPDPPISSFKNAPLVAAEVTRLISPEKSVVLREPPHVGCYILNSLLWHAEIESLQTGLPRMEAAYPPALTL
jgi:hypothetical protein